MDLSFQEKKQLVNPLHGLHITTILGKEENSGTFLNTLYLASLLKLNGAHLHPEKFIS